MPGIKGMKQRNSRPDMKRRAIWRSIRIIRRFTLADITRTSPGVPYGTVRKVVASLVRHGYVVKTGNYTGGRLCEYQSYQLKKDAVEFPVVCARCKQPITFTHCTPEETEKENGKTEQPQPVSAIQEVSHDPS